jgi:hypothetical protein
VCCFIEVGNVHPIKHAARQVIPGSAVLAAFVAGLFGSTVAAGGTFGRPTPVSYGMTDTRLRILAWSDMDSAVSQCDSPRGGRPHQASPAHMSLPLPSHVASRTSVT